MTPAIKPAVLTARGAQLASRRGCSRRYPSRKAAVVSRVVMVPSRSKTAMVSSDLASPASVDGDRLDEDVESGGGGIEKDPCDRAEGGNEGHEPPLAEQPLWRLGSRVRPQPDGEIPREHQGEQREREEELDAVLDQEHAKEERRTDRVEERRHQQGVLGVE